MNLQYRYSKWDGSQEPFAPGADELLDDLSEALFEQGDLSRALRDLYRRGPQGKNGEKTQGLRDLIERLKQQRQQRLDKFDMGSVMNDLKERLERVKDLERRGADRSVSEAEGRLDQSPDDQKDQIQSLMDRVRQRAESAKQKMDALPESVSGAIRELSDHDFVDADARQEFQDLLDMLAKQMANNVAKQAAENLKGMSGETNAALTEMLRDLNKVLRDRAEGREPDFDGFMDKWGKAFGDNPPTSLDELLDTLQRQMAQMQSLLRSMSEEQRSELMQAMAGAMSPEILQQMAELGMLMNALRPPSDMAGEYRFLGDEPLSLESAMSLMGEMQQMDELEEALEQAARTGQLDGIQPADLRDLLGDEAERALRDLQEIARKLEEQGIAMKKGDRWELSPRAIRKLGEKALGEVFGRLGRSRMGGHRITPVGAGGDLIGDTKPYEMGEAFDVNLNRSVMNALARRGPGTPVKFDLKDFEVDRYESTTSAATALLIDQSSSMWNYGRWPAAKKVAMALQALIQSQFPRDCLIIIGFSDIAKEIKPDHLSRAQPNSWQQGTNMHQAFSLARTRLAKETAGNRQIIMVTDGEPTAHSEGGYPYFSYPPAAKTIIETLKEVKRCTSAGITINTFMLERSQFLIRWVEYVTRINCGRAFYSEPGRLGDYVLIDYVNNRRRRVA